MNKIPCGEMENLLDSEEIDFGEVELSNILDFTSNDDSSDTTSILDDEEFSSNHAYSTIIIRSLFGIILAYSYFKFMCTI